MPDKLDVLLIHHHTENPHRPILLPAMGLLGIADHLQRNGLRAQVVNLGVEQRVDPGFDIVRYVSGTGDAVVGLSVHWFFQLPDSLALARALKEALPRVKVVFGGFSASLFANEIIGDHPYVDAVVKGDGERPFLALCRHYLADGDSDPAAVPNLVYRDQKGGVCETPFSHVITEAELAEARFANMALLKNHEAFFKLGYYPTRRFQDRIDLRDGGLFILQVGRGCPYSCVFCGGSKEAQRQINNRPKPLFQPVEAVMANIRQAMEYGYRNFYVSFDPTPNGSYYFEFFQRIRRERLRLGFIFGCWDLPSPDFIDAFANTFEGGIFEISPETANEQLRSRSKGPLSFSNQKLDRCLAHLEERDVACQLFYGFFLPGDTEETVSQTLRAVHQYEGPGREAFYLAFSTDPGSLIQSRPKEHDVVTSVHVLHDYLDALGQKRLSSNLLAHRPSSMTLEAATELEVCVVMDQLLYKMLPASVRFLRVVVGDSNRFYRTMDRLCTALARDAIAHGLVLDMSRTMKVLDDAIQAEVGGEVEALLEVMDYESTPYSLLESHFGGMGMHYTSCCDEVVMSSDDLQAFRDREDTATDEHDFQYDVKTMVTEILAGSFARPKSNKTTVVFVLEQSGRFVTYYCGKSE